MGYNENRFMEKIDDEFICGICHDVIESPQQINAECEHIFCSQCISNTLVGNLCPFDRNTIDDPRLKKPSRYWLRNYGNIQIKCRFITHGCSLIVKLDDLENHENTCFYNDNAVVQCEGGCEAMFARREQNAHNCLNYLKAIINNNVNEITSFKSIIESEYISKFEEQRYLIKELECSLSEVIKKLEDQQTTIDNLKKNPVPIGFIYVQLSGQPEPMNLWPSLGWENVTSHYAGLFFRAEGGGSGSFDQIQSENSPRITAVTSSIEYDSCGTIALVSGQTSQRIYTGSYGGTSSDYSVSFTVSGGEVRPRNKAIRIWKRIT